MGRTHALSGVTLFLGATPLLGQVTPMGWREITLGSAVCAGAALLPDLDHPSSTIARSLGPVTGALSGLTVRLFGPHRHGTHSYAFAGLWLLAGLILGPLGGWWALVPVFLAVSLAAGSVLHERGVANGVLAALAGGAMVGGPYLALPLVAAVGLALWTVLPRLLALPAVVIASAVGYQWALRADLAPVSTGWLGLALGLGCLAHVIGDRLTDAPMALYWPVSRRLVPSWGLFVTDTHRETVFASACTLGSLLLAVHLADGWDDLRLASQVIAAVAT